MKNDTNNTAGSDCSGATCSALPTSLVGIMEWIKTLSEEHGEEKAIKIIECLQGVALALKCFNEDVAMASVETLHKILQAAKPDNSNGQNANVHPPL